MNAQDDAEGKQRETEKGFEQGATGQRFALAGNRGMQQIARAVAVIDACQPPGGNAVFPAARMKAEAVVAGNGDERRDMEDLAPLDGFAVADWPAIGVRQQIVVALAEGIVHFGQDRDQRTRTIVAKP